MIIFLGVISLLLCSKVHLSFKDHDQGTYSQPQLDDDWNNGEESVLENWSQGISEGRVDIIGDEAMGNVLRVLYPSGGVGPSEGGAQWRLELNGESEEMYSGYFIKFPENFDSVLGGKLPGLCGGECPTGGNAVTGTNGFSARYMFRTDNKLVIYCYHMDQPSVYGEDFNLENDEGGDFEFIPGEWYFLKQRIKMNTVGEYNGEIEVWVNDIQRLLKTDLRFRSTTDVKVDKFYFSTFYGGSGSEWAPNKDEHILFNAFVVNEDGKNMNLSSSSTRLFNDVHRTRIFVLVIFIIGWFVCLL